MTDTTHRRHVWLMLVAFLLVSAQPVMAHDIEVAPFLQNATPNGMWIVWETSGGTESLVEWGQTESLGNSATGTSRTNWVNELHEVELTGLEPGTRYYYRATTDDAVSEIYHFITPPDPADEMDFRLVAMSDMQIDSGNPEIYSEVIDDGIIRLVQEQFGSDLAEELALILIPGDLVESGWTFSQWIDDFFGPSDGLMNYVPIYPAIGNHEADSPYYFNYFHLPENGSAGFLEHWYYTDYSNLRIITLDSNWPYTTDGQLEWLEGVLDETCDEPHIDFVFAQLHHPYLSELWLDGETDFSGEVIGQLEAFSTRCEKPSVHFFGHTHGYSRGQSRDHEHLWVNVASAGGNLDYWGEYAQADYPEFTVTRPDWGFVLIEVEAGEAPLFRLRRVSRGDEFISLDNEITDEITIRVNNTQPSTPSSQWPIAESVSPDCVVLTGSVFSDADDDAHSGSQWQVSEQCEDFSAPLVDSWQQAENWYFGVDTQAGDDLTDETVETLAPNTDYCWRVRYRDAGLQWSEWSTPSPFTTTESTLGANLLSNPGAEDGTDHWTVTEGVFESLTAGECGGGNPHSGTRYFAVGGLCTESAYGEVRQRINLSDHASEVDGGDSLAELSGYLSDWSGSDRPEMEIIFYDETGDQLGRSERVGSSVATWLLITVRTSIPVGTRSADVVMMGTRNAGVDNDSYFDDLSFRIDPVDAGCDGPPPDIGDPDPTGDTPEGDRAIEAEGDDLSGGDEDGGTRDAGPAEPTGGDIGPAEPDRQPDLSPDADRDLGDRTPSDAGTGEEDGALTTDSSTGPDSEEASELASPGDDGGCSCGTASGGAGLWLLLLALFPISARRRRGTEFEGARRDGDWSR